MITIKGTVQDESNRVKHAVKASEIRSLGRAAAYIWGIARRSISKKKGPSEPGKTPRSPTGRLKGSLAFNVDKAAGEAVIGPARAAIALIGHTHEFGGVEGPKRGRARGRFWKELRLGGAGPIRIDGKTIVFGRLETMAQVQRAKALAAELPPQVTGARPGVSRRYPQRPFMRPALQRSRERLPSFWRNSIRGN